VCYPAAILTGFLACGAAASRPGHVECKEIYDIAATTAITILPPPLHAFFETRLEAFGQAAAPRARVVSDSKAAAEELQWHYVWLDIAAGAAGIDERRAAARRFPRERDKAVALYESCGVREGGLLPWILQDRYESAVKAFRSGNPEKIAAESGALLHFCVDAAMPFNTTSGRFANSTNEDEVLMDVRMGYHCGAVQIFGEQLEYEVRVYPGRRSPKGKALDAAFDATLDAFDAAEELRSVEAQLASELRLAENHLTSSHTTALLHRLNPRVAAILETRIESGALLAANLIAGAWEEAGKPELKSAATAPPSRVVAIPNAIAVLYVGTQNSTVYHHHSCSHAARIKLENRVTFESVAKARAAGRTPCKACRPGAPPKPPPR